MSRISIAVLDRSGDADIDAFVSGMPAAPDADVTVVAPGDVQAVAVACPTPRLRRVAYPAAMPPAADAVLAATCTGGELLIVTDAQTPFRSWEINSISQALSEAADVVLCLHRPKGREAENVADLAALALNAMLRQPHLSASSLLRFPYGLRRSALDRVDVEALGQPPVFLLECVRAGLRVDTFYRADEPGPPVPDPRALVAMYLRAMDAIVRESGPRGGFSDFGRMRSAWQSVAKAVPEP